MFSSSITAVLLAIILGSALCVVRFFGLFMRCLWTSTKRLYPANFLRVPLPFSRVTLRAPDSLQSSTERLYPANLQRVPIPFSRVTPQALPSEQHRGLFARGFLWPSTKHLYPASRLCVPFRFSRVTLRAPYSSTVVPSAKRLRRYLVRWQWDAQEVRGIQTLSRRP